MELKTNGLLPFGLPQLYLAGRSQVNCFSSKSALFLSDLLAHLHFCNLVIFVGCFMISNSIRVANKFIWDILLIYNFKRGQFLYYPSSMLPYTSWLWCIVAPTYLQPHLLTVWYLLPLYIIVQYLHPHWLTVQYSQPH